MPTHTVGPYLQITALSLMSNSPIFTANAQSHRLGESPF